MGILLAIGKGIGGALAGAFLGFIARALAVFGAYEAGKTAVRKEDAQADAEIAKDVANAEAQDAGLQSRAGLDRRLSDPAKRL